VVGFGLALARLGERGRVDRLDHAHAGGHRLAQAGVTRRGSISSLAPAAARPARRRLFVRRDAHAVGRQRGASAAGTLPSATNSVASSGPTSACATKTGL
jgi:hypothetical protein